MEHLDVAIIGGGAAGITAAIYATRKALKTALFEPGPIGGTALEAAGVENYLGFPSIMGADLAAKFEEHLRAFPDVLIVPEKVLELKRNGDEFDLKTEAGTEFHAKAVILATGSKHKRLDAPGEKEFAGKGVSYCTTCDGPLFKNKAVAMVGGGDSAVQGAIYLADIARVVHLVHRRNEFRAEEFGVAKVRELEKQGKVVVHTPATVAALEGTGRLARMVLENVETKARTGVPVDGLFIKIGQEPQTTLAKMAGANVDAKGHVVVDKWCRTNVPGFYAAGDVTGIGEQFVVSASDGCLAALDAYDYLKRNGKK